MTGSRLPILSAGQVAPYLGGMTAAIKSVWANRKALVCLWGVNGERHWRQEVLRKWKALYCAPEWPGVGFLSNPMGKPHYRSLHRVITTGQWSSSDPLHLNDNITSLHSFFSLVWPDDDPCGTGDVVSGLTCWSYSREVSKIRFIQVPLKVYVKIHGGARAASSTCHQLWDAETAAVAVAFCCSNRFTDS